MAGNPIDEAAAQVAADSQSTTPKASLETPGAPPTADPYGAPDATPALGGAPVGEAPPAVDIGGLPPDIMNPEIPPPPPESGQPAKKSTAETPIKSAADVFSQDLGDYIDPDLLAQLKASASDDKMDVTTAITMAGLAMSNPELLTQIMAHRESSKQNARALLTQLQGQISTSRRTAMAAETSLQKAQQAADAADTKTRFQANAKSVGELADRLHREGVQQDVPQPTGADLADDEKVQAYLQSGSGKLEQKQQRVAQVNQKLAVIQNMAEKGVMDPKLVPQAMREVYKNAGYTDQEIDSQFSAQLMIAQSAAESMAKMKAAERARFSAQTKAAETPLMYTARKLDIMQQQVDVQKMRLSLDQQNEMRLDMANLEMGIAKYTAWADTAGTNNPELATDAANRAAQMTEQLNGLKTRAAGLLAQNHAMSVSRSVDNYVGQITAAKESVIDSQLKRPPGTTHTLHSQGVYTDEENSYTINKMKQAATDAVLNSIQDDDIRASLKARVGAQDFATGQ